MWLPVTVRHDDELFERIFEKPLIDKVAHRLNELEKEHGAIEAVKLIESKENEYAQLIVRVKENND